GRRVLRAWSSHGAGRTERAGRRVVQLSRCPDPVLAGRGAVVATREQDATVVEEGRGRTGTRLTQRTGRTECAGRRLIHLGGRAAPARERDAPVGQPRRGLADRTVLCDRRRAGPAKPGRE